MMPKISIILPIYNVENYLRRCIDSLLNQSLEDIEIILATDGPQACDDICEEYAQKDSRIKVVMHPGSYGKAFNKSLEIATGDYIGIVETDDWCDENMFKMLYDRAFATRADVVKCGFCFAHDDASKNTFETYSGYGEQLMLETEQDFFSSQPSVWSCIYKRDFLIVNNIKMIEKRASFIDTPFHYETLYKAKRYEIIHQPLYYYYQDNPNQTVRNVKSLDGLDAEKFAYNKFLNDKETYYKYREGLAMATALHLKWNYNRIDKNKLEEFWNASHDFLNSLPLEGLDYRYFDDNLFEFFGDVLNYSYKKYKKQKIFKTIYSVRKSIYRKTKTILGLKFRKVNNKWIQAVTNDKIRIAHRQIAELKKENENLKLDMFYLALNSICSSDRNLLFSDLIANIACSTDENSTEMLPLKKLFSKEIKNIKNYSSPCDAYLLWGTKYWQEQYECIKDAKIFNKPLFVIEDGFLKSVASPWDKTADIKYRNNLSYTINSKTVYFDSSAESELEKLMNDESLVITDEQKQRARACIDKIVSNNLTKYNHQPIFNPQIGRDGVKKVLVIDQSYGDMAISRANAGEQTFKKMLECAIRENPEADIIVKTHPDTILGAAKGYYTGVKQHDNVYPYTEAINPVSLIKYCDEVYVCSSQMGFEALMCGKKVHNFGISFYSNYGLTVDKQVCPRRKVKRTLEEAFYIIYIMFSYYVNPIDGKKCEIEEIIDYIIEKRLQYFEGLNEH